MVVEMFMPVDRRNNRQLVDSPAGVFIGLRHEERIPPYLLDATSVPDGLTRLAIWYKPTDSAQREVFKGYAPPWQPDQKLLTNPMVSITTRPEIRVCLSTDLPNLTWSQKAPGDTPRPANDQVSGAMSWDYRRRRISLFTATCFCLPLRASGYRHSTVSEQAQPILRMTLA